MNHRRFTSSNRDRAVDRADGGRGHDFAAEPKFERKVLVLEDFRPIHEQVRAVVRSDAQRLRHRRQETVHGPKVLSVPQVLDRASPTIHRSKRVVRESRAVNP